jgi:hypothetical protein
VSGRGDRGERLTATVLWVLLGFDLMLVTVTFGFPNLWFTVFHGTQVPADLTYFQRAGAQWAGFALVQAIALVRWRGDRRWLAAVAGVRLCDVFTDWAALAAAHEHTWFAWVSLAAMGVINAALAWFLFVRARLPGAATSSGRPG